MARETKAQRIEREEREEAEREAQVKAGYFSKLMDVLGRATTYDYSMWVVGGKFVVCDPNTNEKWCMYPEYNNTSNWVLSELESELDRVEETEREAERKFQAKQAALRKLTKEERKLLGV